MIPPCAYQVLLSFGRDALVSITTRAPPRAAASEAAQPPRPLPITSTSVSYLSMHYLARVSSGSRSRAMSTEGAEWVRAPTEMVSTPPSANCRTF